MVVKRNIPIQFRREIEKQETGEFPLFFLRLTHPKIFPDIRIVSDPENFILPEMNKSGLIVNQEYVGFEFGFDFLTDDEGPPKATLSVQNVDRIIGESVRQSVDPIHVYVDIIAASQFDLSVFPRVPLATPVERVARVQHAELIDVEGDSMFLTGTIRVKDYTQETYPGMRATEARTPGLYW